MIKRYIDIKKVLKPGKVLIIYGPRQVGKTTLVLDFLENTDLRIKAVTGDDLKTNNLLSQCTVDTINDFVGDYELVFIDEAHKIPNIGLALKIMVDLFKDRYFIVTGSSPVDIKRKTGESLTGRKRVVNLFPISLLELSKVKSRSELRDSLESYLIYGLYPEVINSKNSDEKFDAIEMISNSYLLRDVLDFEGIKSSKTILNILKLLAFQVGSEVSSKEIGNSVGIDHKTVLRYLDLFEQSYIIFSLGGFSRNLRKEVNKMSKYYFYDTGIRNALISNFNTLDKRNDIGQLWENFLIAERMKRNAYLKLMPNYYFWRTYDQVEIDLIEESGGKLNGFEFKWKERSTKPPQLWLSTYPNGTYKEINKENYLDFVL